jgi:7-cyano-7-deazaguanine reductase
METKKDDVSMLKSLGSKNTVYPNEGGIDPTVLETFPNQNPDKDTMVHFKTREHTSLCPRSGQPDFATIIIDYVPNQLCVESKSLKLYLFSFRSAKTFMETQTNTILIHLVELLKPRWMRVIGDFAPRGGIDTVVTAMYTHDKGYMVLSDLVQNLDKGE